MVGGVSARAYGLGKRRARGDLAAIPAMLARVEAIEKILGTPDFEARSELFTLLAGVSAPEERSKLLEEYRRGLTDVQDERRLTLKVLWRHSFAPAKADADERHRILDVLVDSACGQAIVAVQTIHDEDVKGYSFHALDLESRKQRWKYEGKRGNVWRPQIAGDKVLFIHTASGGEDSSGTHTLYVISARNGGLLLKWKPDKNDADMEVLNRDIGAVANLLITSGYEHLMAIDLDRREEQWRHRGRGDIVVPTKDGMLLQIGDRTLGWFTLDGKLLRQQDLSFPVRGEGKIALAAFDDKTDILYLGVRDSKWKFDAKGNVIPGSGWEYTVVHALNRNTGQILWSKQFTAFYREMILKENMLYLCSEYGSRVLGTGDGEVAAEVPYEIRHVIDKKLLICKETKQISGNEEEAIVAYDPVEERTLWRVKDFELRLATDVYLFGEVDERRVILDPRTGLERAVLPVNDYYWGVYPVSADRYLVKDGYILYMLSFSEGR